MPNVVTIREAVQRAKSEGLRGSEYTLRRWLKTGAIPARNIGKKVLIYYPNLVKYIQCEDGCDNAPTTVISATGIRRIDVG